MCNSEFIGEQEWYPLGAKQLVSTQDKDGHWQGDSEDPLQATSFALLFLTRATAPVRKDAKRGGKGWLETHAMAEHENFFFILDASGSMRDEMDGKEKFEIAKDVIEQVIKQLPEGAHVGLRVYGHRRTALDKDADTDSELVVPVGAVNKDQFLARMRALKCRGKTPITYSLRETIGDLKNLESDIEIAVILLTDGEESTRGAKPVQAAGELARSRKNLKLHVVGFDIDNDDAKAQLEQVSHAGGGKYFHARKAQDLMNALTFATLGQSQYTLLSKDGKQVLKGKLGDRHELPEGKYTYVVEIEGRKEERALWINTEVTTHLTVNLSAYVKK